MTEMFIRALAAIENPSLSAILMNSKCQSPLLNENVEDEIFMVRYRSGPHKGTWRIRATNYNPFEGTFTLNSDHLDIREGHWLNIPGQKLNDMFLSGNVKHLTKDTCLLLPEITEIRHGIIIKENLCGSCCEVRLGKARRYKWAIIGKYNSRTNSHVFTLDGGLNHCQTNLSELLLDKRLRLPSGPLHNNVSDRIRSTVDKSRTPASAVTSARPMPKGG